MSKNKDKIYPLHYDDKIYTKDNVDYLFDAFYYDRNQDIPVYVSDGLYVYPDGETYDTETNK